jgi:hypothetical protein
MFSRLEVTPNYKGNPAGQYDPLPGDLARLKAQRGPGLVKRALATVLRRGRR